LLLPQVRAVAHPSAVVQAPAAPTNVKRQPCFPGPRKRTSKDHIVIGKLMRAGKRLKRFEERELALADHAKAVQAKFCEHVVKAGDLELPPLPILKCTKQKPLKSLPKRALLPSVHLRIAFPSGSHGSLSTAGSNMRVAKTTVQYVRKAVAQHYLEDLQSSAVRGFLERGRRSLLSSTQFSGSAVDFFCQFAIMFPMIFWPAFLQNCFCKSQTVWFILTCQPKGAARVGGQGLGYHYTVHMASFWTHFLD
jgi:hypothetical protein